MPGIYTESLRGSETAGDRILPLTTDPLPLTNSLTHEVEHFAGGRVATGRLLGKEQLAVEGHLEDAAGALDHRDLDPGEGLPELGRQTGGPGLIVSDDAELDRELHGGSRVVGHRWCTGQSLAVG